VTDELVYAVFEKPAVVEDYLAITQHIQRWVGDRDAADRTVDSIRAFVKALSRTPHRGRKRDDLRAGLRIASFKKRTAVAFEIDDEARTVTVLRVFYGGQDYEAVFREE
jgi:plasmid stabilization system protein ParE